MSLNDVNTKISNLWERLALGLISLFVTILFMIYQGQQADFKALETRVLDIQMDKVSKEDLSAVERRINKNLDARINELISRSASDKQDILQRLDLSFKKSLP